MSGLNPGGRERLFARAASEVATTATDVPVPPGVDATVFAPRAAGSAEAAKASRSLTEALAAARAMEPPTALAPIAVREADDESKAEAEKRYAGAKGLIAAGKPEDALPELQQAAKLDPAAAGPWEQIAVVHAMAGRRSAATAAWQQAVRRGSKDQDVLRALAREALRNLRAGDALWLLAKSRRDDAKGESLSDVSADVDLAEALDRSGFDAAAAELYGRTLARPEIQQGSARAGGELADVIRRRGDLWQRAGDLAMRQGDPEKARMMYEAAAEFPMLDAGALAVRRVYASVRAGRPATAAAALVKKIEAGGGNVEERELGLITYLARVTDVGPDLAGSLAESPALKDASPSVRGRATRAAAAALKPEQTRSLLLKLLETQPGDTEAMSDLAGTFAASELSDRDSVFAELAETSPRNTDTYAAMLLADGRGIGAAAKRYADRSDHGSRLLGAYLHLALGKPTDAVRLIADVAEWPASVRAAALSSAVDVAATSGQYAKAIAWLDALRAAVGPQASPADRVSLARGLASLQRDEEAMAALGDQLLSLSPDDRLAAAAIARQAGKLEVAETLLRSLSDADPSDERPAEMLITLYARGPLADESRLAAVIQKIRSRVSSSRVLRWAVANEQAQRQQWAPAEQTLRGLADEDPGSPGLIELLTFVWTRAGGETAAHGREWLLARLAVAPESTDTLAALSHLEAVGGKPDEAISRLDARLNQWPITKLAALKERILRDVKGEKPAARELAIKRLSAGPRTIDGTLELAALLLEAGRPGEIAGVLKDASGLPAGVPLSASQKSRLAAIAAETSSKDADVVAAGGEPASPALIQLLTERGIEVPPALREYRVLLLSSVKSPDEAAIAAAFKEAVPDQGMRPISADRITQKLVHSASPRAAVAFRFAYTKMLDEPSPEALAVLGGVVGEVGDAADLRRAMPIMTSGTRGQAVMARLRGGDEDMPKPTDIPAELASEIAGYAMSLDRVAEAVAMYKYVIELDPQHASACNDLGYQLVDDNDPDHALAEKLLERSYTLSGPNYNVADSLAWLRYKQGRLTDKDGVPGPEGLGAVTLIEDAVKLHELDRDARLFANPTIYDHQGDIYWAAGRKDDAKRAWDKAKAAMPAALVNEEDLTGNGARLRHFRRVMTQTRDRLNSKLEAVRKGDEPPVTPRWTK